jgi:hypothetical protein
MNEIGIEVLQSIGWHPKGFLTTQGYNPYHPTEICKSFNNPTNPSTPACSGVWSALSQMTDTTHFRNLGKIDTGGVNQKGVLYIPEVMGMVHGNHSWKSKHGGGLQLPQHPFSPKTISANFWWCSV